ncbi:MAG: sigma-70 family RNA polymerase sigma factor [Planctomycetes bacterium]|nr:sigma-70 family RNA polymerase sigma factor [Planctomycetota bacterium]
MLTNEQRSRLGEWVRAVAPRAVAFARSLVREPSRADDVVQEAFYRLLRKADEYDLERDGLKLLFRTITNLCINATQRDKELVSLSADEDRPIEVPDRGGVAPDEAAAGRELESAVAAALQKLPALQRAAVELRALGLSKEEIAEALGVTPTNAGVLVFRGRKALAAELGLKDSPESA